MMSKAKAKKKLYLRSPFFLSKAKKKLNFCHHYLRCG